jgi:hypothetical protein
MGFITNGVFKMRKIFIEIDLDKVTLGQKQDIIDNEAPWACRAIDVDGGIMCFESEQDYQIFQNQI